MFVCRLCLQNIEDRGISNAKEILQRFKKFVPQLSRRLVRPNVPKICEICSYNINSAWKLLKNKNEADTKIVQQLDRLKVPKIDLRGFHRNINMSANLGVCRLCLKLINCPRIFLCENSTNILHHDYIKIMLTYCNIAVDLDLSHRPVMCINCWELLNITYTCVKDFLEVEKKIGVYCQVFKIKKKDVTKKMLETIRDYFFSDEYCQVTGVYIKKENKFEFPYVSDTDHPEDTKNIKEQPKAEFPHIIPGLKTKKALFNESDNRMLIRVYFEVTKNEKDFHRGYWKRLQSRWAELNPEKPFAGMKLSQQIHNIVRKQLISKTEIEKIKGEVNRILTNQTLIEETMEEEEESEFDSDDSFVEEAVPSRFTPEIKSEPIWESDIEFNIIEPKVEPESDCESLPTLERMDNSSFDVTNICTVEVKREVFENYMRDDEDNSKLDSQNDDSLNRSKRDSLKLRSKEIFRCKKCSFETTDRLCVDRHAVVHRRMNSSIYVCPECPYRIPSKWLFKKHMRTHDVQNEIPVLEAQCYPYSFDVNIFHS